MKDDPAFIWERRPTPPRRPPRAAPATREEAAPITPPTGERITLRDAEHRFGVTVSTLRTWARKGSIDAAMMDGPSGRQWMVTPESVAHHLSRSPEPRRAGAAKPTGRTGPTGDGSAMLVPRDAWDKLMDQLGNLHEAGLMLAEARERAARAETEASFLRERLADLRSERDALRGGHPPDPGDTPRRAWWRLPRVRRH